MDKVQIHILMEIYPMLLMHMKICQTLGGIHIKSLILYIGLIICLIIFLENIISYLKYR